MARFTLHRTAPASCASCASTSTRARRARTALRTRCMGERTSASRCPCGSQATSSVKTNTRAKKRSRSRVITRSRSDRKDGLYELLGVSPKSSQKEIKTAYRRLAKANHPDVGGDPEKFKSIAKAYAVLSTPGARKEYDRQQYRASNYSSYSSYTSSVEDTFDFFAKKAKEEDFYGLGDLFRDIEQEFSGMKDESSIFKKLGEDLLDFLEGSAYAPEEQKSGESGGTKASGGSQASQSSQSSQSSQRSQKRPEASSASRRRRPSSPAGTTSASFDAELELQELKRQMREGK